MLSTQEINYYMKHTKTAMYRARFSSSSERGVTTFRPIWDFPHKGYLVTLTWVTVNERYRAGML
jgi:hypothetical protein